MLKNIKSIAGAAIILAAIATASAQAKQIETEAQKIERIEKQTKALTPAPYFWLVLGVGF
jgi:hypothetical protein